MIWSRDSELNAKLTAIRNFSLDVLKLTYEMSIPSELAPPTSFWKSYTDEKLAIGLHTCLALWAASGEKMVPLEFQLTATIALMSGQDSLVDVGTGYGKTLCMIIPCLLSPSGSNARFRHFCQIRIAAQCLDTWAQVHSVQIPDSNIFAGLELLHSVRTHGAKSVQFKYPIPTFLLD